VAVAIGKLDALFFIVGILAGIFVFGSSVDRFSRFNVSGRLGSLTLPQWMNINTGLVTLAVVLIALAAFWASEKSEGSWRLFARLYGKSSKQGVEDELQTHSGR
jgi:hypothetical protein